LHYSYDYLIKNHMHSEIKENAPRKDAPRVFIRDAISSEEKSTVCSR